MADEVLDCSHEGLTSLEHVQISGARKNIHVMHFEISMFLCFRHYWPFEIN